METLKTLTYTDDGSLLIRLSNGSVLTIDNDIISIDINNGYDIFISDIRVCVCDKDNRYADILFNRYDENGLIKCFSENGG